MARCFGGKLELIHGRAPGDENSAVRHSLDLCFSPVRRVKICSECILKPLLQWESDFLRKMGLILLFVIYRSALWSLGRLCYSFYSRPWPRRLIAFIGDCMVLSYYVNI